MTLKDRTIKLNMAMTRMLSALLFFALLLTGTVRQEASALSPLDPARGTELTVALAYEGTALPGATLSLYRVGSMDENANLTPDAIWSGFDVSDPKNRSEWDRLAQTMAAFAGEKRIQPLKSGKTDANGRVVFGNGLTLTGGLYLVVGDDFSYQDVKYTTLPFLVTLPNWNAETNAWDYAVTASPKLDREVTSPPTPAPRPSPTPYPSPVPTSVFIPQTGMLWWPIPPLLFVGIALMISGFLLRKRH